jgi:hypothetical protein
MATHVDSRDLSEVFEKCLDVTIIGIGSGTTLFRFNQALITHVAHVYANLTGMPVRVFNPSYAPWQLVSLNREKRRLIVKAV